MKIVSWNVNSVRVRLPLIEHLIDQKKPDVILLQETKCMDDAFPREFFESYNYNIAMYGQKTYNGVAILSKYPIEEIKYNLDDSDECRYIEGFTNGIYVASIYVPCGNKSDEAYEYKQQFLSQIAKRWTKNEKIILGGDFNVAISDDDIQTPKKWIGSVLCTDEVRNGMNEIFESNFLDAHDGFTELIENKNELVKNHDLSKKNDFTWWDYRRPYEGLRIDYILHKNLQGKLQTLKDYRKMERPSDHVPILFEVIK